MSEVCTCKEHGRSPYDPTRYHEDEFDEVIAFIVNSWYYQKQDSGWGAPAVIVLSGRDEKYKPETQTWLRKFDFEYDELYMRPEGDERNDAIVKDELFELYIAGKYNIDFVLDDRQRVVDMWRSKGIKCLQVAPGDF